MDPGVLLVSAGAVVALMTAFALRTRLPAAVVLLVLAAAGAALGWGGSLLRPDPSTGETVGITIALAVLVPFHVRIVLGAFGPKGSGKRIRALTDPEPPPT